MKSSEEIQTEPVAPGRSANNVSSEDVGPSQEALRLLTSSTHARKSIIPGKNPVDRRLIYLNWVRHNSIRAIESLPSVFRQSASSLRYFLVFIAILPSIWAIFYFGFFATGRYVSEASFVVRNASRTSVGGGFSAFLRMVGVSSSQDDTFAVHNFITSKDAVQQLSKQINLREIFGSDGVDMIARYPNVIYGESLDDLHRYLKGRIEVYFNSNTGVSTLKVQAFKPEHAQHIASLLLAMGEDVINRMNARIRGDTVNFTEREVIGSESRLKATNAAITAFRNAELHIDPARSSILTMELVAKLTGELSRLQALITEARAASPDSPQLQALIRRSNALQGEINSQRERINDRSDGLANKIATYEELVLERELAAKSLASAMLSLDTARSEARRQQLYLERIAGPSIAEIPLLPERSANIASVFAMNAIFLLIAWLIRTGVAEHSPKIED